MTLKNKLTKHDRYILELRDKIQDRYDSISINVKVSNKKRNLVEIDLVGKIGDKVDLYEVKCSHRIIKARKQLKKIKRILNLHSSKSYFYCGSSGILVSV